MINDLDIEQINQRIDAFFTGIPKEYWRFFSRRSLSNFIYYLPKIKGRTEQEEIAAAINAYLDEVENLSLIEVDMALAKYLFEKHLYPAARKFEWRCGFVPVLSLRGCLVLFPQIALVFYLVYLWNHICCYIVVLAFIAYVVRVAFKIKERKVYGLAF